jgi:signal recognition particle subunit SRP54
MGMGEKTEALEPFHPDRVASRILDLGDIMTLVEDAERKIDKKKADKLTQKLKSGKGFDLEDFRDQLRQMNNMGGITSMLDKLPGMSGAANMAKQSDAAEGQFKQMDSIICSMTPLERHLPDKINGSRKKRIARGSGTQIQDINRLLKQHKQMQKMMKKMTAKGGMKKMMRAMGGMNGGAGGGGMPPMMR